MSKRFFSLLPFGSLAPRPRTGVVIPLFFLVLVFSPIYMGKGVAEVLDSWLIQYENAKYKYLTKNLFEASADFNELLQSAEEDQVGKALHFSILSLAAMNQRKEVLHKLKIYRKSIRAETLFGAAEKFFEWGDYAVAEEILEISRRMDLSEEELDRQSLLSGKTLVHLEESRKKPLEYLTKITEKSDLYLEAQSLKARLFFRDREFEAATAILESLLLKFENNSIPGGKGESAYENTQLLLGKIYFEEREFNKAAAHFSSIRGEGPLYPALEGLYWVHMRSGQFLEAVSLLLRIKTEYPERFKRDGYLVNLAFSAYYAKEYSKAAGFFEELKGVMDVRKRAMERILAESEEAPEIAISVVKGFFSNDGAPPVGQVGVVENFSDNGELADFFEKRVMLETLAESGAGIARKNSELQMTYRMEFGALDSFVDKFDKRVERLHTLYGKLKGEVGNLNFQVGGTVHNKNYFKEWFESNLSQLSEGKMHQLTDFEQKIVQMFTHEIMYRQKVDTDFITKIVANKKSLENLHSLASTEWPIRVKKIISDHELGLKELDHIGVIFNRLKELNEEINSLGKELIRQSVASVKKEAFRILIWQESIEGEIESAYAKTREALLKPSSVGTNGKFR